AAAKLRIPLIEVDVVAAVRTTEPFIVTTKLLDQFPTNQERIGVDARRVVLHSMIDECLPIGDNTSELIEHAGDSGPMELVALVSQAVSQNVLGHDVVDVEEKELVRSGHRSADVSPPRLRPRPTVTCQVKRKREWLD